jgi:hypothetical protein
MHSMFERKALLKKLDDARQKVANLLSEAEKYSESEIYPGWTLKEMLAHMTGWDDAVITSLRAHLAGNEPGTPADRGIDEYNESTVTTREPLDYDHICKEWQKTREILITIIQDMPEEKFQEALILPWGEKGTVKYLVDIFVHHEHTHARDIAEWLKDPTQPLVGRH